MTPIAYSIVVPVCNSEQSLPKLYARLKQVFEQELRQSFELILVDDGSVDRSWQVMQTLRRKDKRVILIRLRRNLGQHRALACGFRFSSGARIVTLDDDLQNPPEEIPRLISRMQSGFELVMGIHVKKQHAPYRHLGTWVMNVLYSWLFKKPWELRFSNFRLFTQSLCQVLGQSAQGQYLNLNAEFMKRLTPARIANVAVQHRPRPHGQSQYSFRKLIKMVAELLLGYSWLARFGVKPAIVDCVLNIQAFEGLSPTALKKEAGFERIFKVVETNHKEK